MDTGEAMRLEEQLKRFIRWNRSAHPPIDGLSRSAISVLAATVRSGSRAPRPGELALELNMTTSNIASALRELDAGGYVSREPNAHDGRRVDVVLTDKGRTAMAQRRATKSTRLQQAIESTLDDREQRELLAAGDLLERISGHPAS
ncbi:MAG TPA: MarR family winged helix-turn-helix transcriptional regulator [Leifsonia sp.]|jgi:DNA-binding MarR family transcriptional regulator|nr:MarR family winged helix-turn-helix transcriptional regulator [Leifsonia sp.]